MWYIIRVSSTTCRVFICSTTRIHIYIRSTYVRTYVRLYLHTAMIRVSLVKNYSHTDSFKCKGTLDLTLAEKGACHCLTTKLRTKPASDISSQNKAKVKNFICKNLEQMQRDLQNFYMMY